MLRTCLQSFRVNQCSSIPSIYSKQITLGRCLSYARSNSFQGSGSVGRGGQDAHDDQTLRRVFDSQPFWHEFRKSSQKLSERNVGLFHNKYLTEPAGFLTFASDVRKRCETLVSEITHASTRNELRSILKKFDLLSDYLCRVLDLADFVRATHPDPKFQQCAIEAYTHLWEYMNVLNTTPGLKEQLQRILGDADITSTWTEEETKVAHNLMKDFSNSAINQPPNVRQRFVDLSNEVKQLGSAFIENMGPAQSYLQLKSRDVSGLDPTLLKKHTSRLTGLSLPLGTDLAYNALSSIHSETARRSIYAGMRTVSRKQVQILEELLRVRSELAKLSGFSSYGDMNLSDKMAQSPGAVDSFLRALSSDNASHVAREIRCLQAVRESDGLIGPIQASDILYYQTRLKVRSQPTFRPNDGLASFFSLGTVMQGLSRLFDRLYGVRFIPSQPALGEQWEPNVRRLNVVHEDDGHLAVLYCDLFEREGKSPNPTHFTLRCARQLSEDELADTSMVSNDGMARSQSKATGTTSQLPTIALICDFPSPGIGGAPTLLSFRDVQTLFHEMGHAIHSILGRTAYQVVSGTRCVTDFAELPSVLMESFAADQSVLNLFARHWKTDTPLPFEMINDSIKAQKQYQGLQTETQILYSLLDQAYHSSRAASPEFDSTETFYDVYDTFGTVREPRGISPQGFFGHLVEYGGTYYSYLFDRAIAGKIWRQVFGNGVNGGGIDRENGEKFRDAVLKWGGAKDPWKCIGDVLDNETLVEGGKTAMEQVGEWGITDSRANES